VFAYLEEQVKSGGVLEGVVNPDLAAVVGHSYGGYTTLAAAGAKINTPALESHCQNAIEEQHEAAWLCEMLIPHLGDMAELAGLDAVPDGLWPVAADPRVDAIISMAGDAFFFGEDGLAEIDIPVMAIGGTADKDSPYTWSTQPAYEYSSSTRKIEIALEDAEHMIFTASCDDIRWYLKFLSGEFCKDITWDRNYAHALTKHFTTAFLLSELKQDQNAELALNSENVNLADVTYKTNGYQ
jgi:predicted dienelactone hydrolase